jgi:DNA modification methylase
MARQRKRAERHGVAIAAIGPANRPRTLGDLVPDPRNANRGTERGRKALDRSLRELGAGRSIVIDREGRIIAGNKTAEAARILGMPLRVIRTSGDHLIAIQRCDLDLLTDVRARQLAISDNRVGELGLDWDIDLLRQFHDDGFDLSPHWTDEEFAALLAQGITAGQTEENAVIEPGPTEIRRGDLLGLGRHRLLCGDATCARDVTRLLVDDIPLLMTTDPPYGVNYDPAWRHRVAPSQRTAVGRVHGDDRADWGPAFALFPGRVAYVWHAGLMAGPVAASLAEAGWTVRAQIIWVKQHFALSRGDYHWGHEPCWYAVRKGQSGLWRGDRTQSTVWQVPNLNPMGGHRGGEDGVTGHGTQKPVRLFEIPILNHTTLKDSTYDPFCGSGTALIAAEKTGRSCFGMDIDPVYIQVAVSRWERFTGRRAERLSDLSA